MQIGHADGATALWAPKPSYMKFTKDRTRIYHFSFPGSLSKNADADGNPSIVPRDGRSLASGLTHQYIRTSQICSVVKTGIRDSSHIYEGKKTILLSLYLAQLLVRRV